MTEIVKYNYSSFKKQYTLDGNVFYIWLMWNSNSEYWYMIIQDANENNIIAPIQLRTLDYLLRNYRAQPGIPLGDFKVEKQSTNDAVTLNYNNLGTDFILYYYDGSEVDYGV